MSRKSILSIGAVVIVATVVGVLVTALLPLWLPALLIRPALINGPKDKIQKTLVQEGSKMMMRSMRGMAG